MIKTARMWLLLALLSVPTFSLANNPNSCMGAQNNMTYSDVIDEAFNNLATNDLSMQVLGAIFGPSYYTLSTGTSGNPPAALLNTSAATDSGTLERPIDLDTQANLGTFSIHNSGIFGILSLFLNALGMVLAGWIVIISGAQGMMNSANEGVVLGKQYSAMWWSLRMATGLIMLIPVFGGFSPLQQAAMVVGRLAVAFTNLMYQVVLAFIGWYGGSFIDPPSRDVTPIFAQMVESEMCTAFATQSGHAPQVTASSGAQMVTRNSARGARTGDVGEVGRYFVDYNVTGGVDETSKSCGSFVVNIPGTYYSGMAPAAKAATLDAYNTFWGAFTQVRQTEARSIANALVNGQPVSASTWSAGANKIQSAQGALIAQMTQAALTSAAGGEDRARVCQAIDELRDLGWMAMGGVYWNLSNISADNYRRISEVGNSIESQAPKTSSMAATLEAPVSGAPFNSRGAVEDYAKARARFESAMREVGARHQMSADFTRPSGELADAVSFTAGGVPQNAASKAWQLISSSIGLRWAADSITASISKDGDVISNLAGVGHTLVSTATVGWTAMMAVQMFKGAQDGAGFWGGVSKFFVPASGAAAGGLAAVIPYLTTFVILPLLVLGLYMAYYLPAVPILYWFSGLTTWVISHFLVVMSMPILAASMFAPQGNGFASDQSRNGFMNILNLGLRAPLMIIGFAGGIAIMQVMGIVIGAIYPLAFRSASMGSLFGFISLIAALVVLYVIVLATANRIYSLVSDMGDEIMEFFGGGRRQLGDERINAQGSQTLGAAFVSRPERMIESAARAPAAAAPKPPKPPGGGGSSNAGSINT